MKAIWNGEVIAQSDATVVVDGNHYFPPQAINQDCLSSSETTSVCGWKGTASYYSVTAAGKTNSDCAWFYPEPKEAAANIKDHVAFWRGVEIVE